MNQYADLERFIQKAYQPVIMGEVVCPLRSLVKQMDQTFSQTLLALIDQKGLNDVDVYRKANLDRRHFSKMRSNVKYNPKKNTVLLLCLAMSLNIDETEHLLATAGYSLSNSNLTDVIIRYYIEQAIFDLIVIDDALRYYGEPSLVKCRLTSDHIA